VLLVDSQVVEEGIQAAETGHTVRGVAAVGTDQLVLGEAAGMGIAGSGLHMERQMEEVMPLCVVTER